MGSSYDPIVPAFRRESTATRLSPPAQRCRAAATLGKRLARFGRTITQAEWVKELKRVSNLWLKKQHLIRGFEWQGGYADFSVSASNLEQVKKYIANQQEHHRKIDFQDELRSFFRKHYVEWDERYVWD